MRFRFRSSKRDESVDASRLGSIEKSIRSALADIEAEKKGLQRRLKEARDQAAMLVGDEPFEYRDREKAKEEKLSEIGTQFDYRRRAPAGARYANSAPAAGTSGIKTDVIPMWPARSHQPPPSRAAQAMTISAKLGALQSETRPKRNPKIETYTPIGSAGHAGIAASSQLTFYPGHSLKAGQSAGSCSCYRQGFLT